MEVMISAVQYSLRVERPEMEKPLLKAKRRWENIESLNGLNTFLQAGHL